MDNESLHRAYNEGHVAGEQLDETGQPGGGEPKIESRQKVADSVDWLRQALGGLGVSGELDEEALARLLGLVHGANPLPEVQPHNNQESQQ
jgi:hypothetical protein